MSLLEAESRRVVTVLFSDIADSSEITERLDPEALRRVLRDYFAIAAAALEHHGGTVEKFIGDAVMAVFGVPRAREDDALRAVRAAVDMNASLERLSDELEAEFGVRLRTRIGVNTGEVVAGDPAVSGTLATGEAVVVARRLEQAAGGDEILVGHHTYHLVRDAVVAEAAGSLALKGLSAPLEAWRIVAVVPEASGVSRNFDAPLVDRERERAALEAAFRRAVDRRSCELVTLLGAPGIGKTRLATEFLTTLGDRAVALEGRCLSYGEGITFWPIREIVRRAAGIAPQDTVADARRKIDALVPDGAAPRAGGSVGAAIGLTDEAAPTEEVFLSLRRIFERLAAEAPLVLVFEDINWAEPTLLDLLEYLAGWSRGAPILLLCLARPDLLENRPSWASTETLLLEPLSDDDMRELIGNAVTDADVAAVAAPIASAAEGNPLFAEEMLRMLVDEGALEHLEGDAAASVIGPIEVPPTIQALLSARLDRLDPNERAVMGIASVIGRQFGWTGVTELAPVELQPVVGASLQALVRKRMVVPDEPTLLGDDAFRFSHILMQDAAYRALPRARLAHLHEAFADWLERRLGERAGEYAEILGYHLEQAAAARRQLGPRDARARELAARAGRLLAAAGSRALARDDVPAALSLLERASVLLVDDGVPLVNALLDLAAALRESGQLARADGVLERAIERAGELRRDDLSARALVERSSLRAFVDPDVEAADLLSVAEGAISRFEQHGDDLGLARAWIHVAEIHWMRCRCGDMETVLERALVHAERAAGRREISWILGSLARAVLLGPKPVEEATRRAIEVRERGRGDIVVEAYADSIQAVLEAMRGNGAEARAFYGRTKATLAEVGLNVLLASLQMYAGMAELILADYAAANRELRIGYDALERMGERSYLSTMAAYLARSSYLDGRFEEAARLTHVSEEAASRDDLASQVLWRGTRARLVAQESGNGAEALVREAIRLSQETDWVDLQADAFVDLAAVLDGLGRSHEAGEAYDTARGLYKAKGNTTSAAAIASRAAQVRLDGPEGS